MYYHNSLMPYFKKVLKSFILLIYNCADIILFLLTTYYQHVRYKKKLQFNPIIKGNTQSINPMRWLMKCH